VSEGAKPEQIRSVLMIIYTRVSDCDVSTYRAVVKDKGGGCVDGRRTCVGRRIDVLARVQLQGLELGLPARRA
jgi:hypothetical protein